MQCRHSYRRNNLTRNKQKLAGRPAKFLDPTSYQGAGGQSASSCRARTINLCQVLYNSYLLMLSPKMQNWTVPPALGCCSFRWHGTSARERGDLRRVLCAGGKRARQPKETYLRRCATQPKSLQQPRMQRSRQRRTPERRQGRPHAATPASACRTPEPTA